jgi:lipopolysaccharide transport system permease protein
MKHLIKLFAYHELIYNLTMRQIKAHFKQSALGILWAVLKPAGTVIILTVVFSHFAKFPSDGIPYPLFSFGALLPWSLFTNAIGAGVPSLTSNLNLITKVYFPREILPLSAILSASLEIAISAVIFVGLLFFYDVRITLNILFVVPIVIIAFIFSFGIVLLLTTINVWYRDVGQATGLLMQFWMYLTPVIYPLSMVPERFKPFYVFNPMVGIVEGFRNALLKGISPDMGLLGISTVIAVITFILGYSIFKAKEFDFADVI